MLRSVLFSLLAPAAVAQCLGNGTHPSLRKNLVNPETGESYPLGITVPAWAASYATSYMAGILIQDLLGINVTYSIVTGQVEAFFSVAGCLTPNNSSDRGCGPEGPSVTYQHLQMETWYGNYPAVWAQTQTFATPPKLLGSMGYEGTEDMYFSSRELSAAYETEGLALDYWTGFDATWKQPGLYFDQPSAVNRSMLKPCADTNLYNDLMMSAYLSASGDTDGVVVQPDGKVVGKCPGDGYFWLSPSCRSDPTKCVLYITGGGGYGLSGVLQRATRWNIPLAFGVGATWGDFVSVANTKKSMFYWWTPDPTFLEMSPVMTKFPAHDKQAWEQGDISTAALGVFIGKIVSHDLSALAPRLVGFLDNIQIDMDTINAMMLDQKTSGEEWEPVMCRWLQNNPQIWSSWMPDDSTCFPKFGMFDEITEQFVSNRDDKEGLRLDDCL
ncbi:unnamed protein product [Cladocopium goreaui]|uniref:Tyrosine-protein kinase ephrin type A/B receptor-like domain-containing protein n=1 Tax=Cladocopium goreaui TaxID=2562237 RepID=A0A9P1DPU7_9DINO|nr:unnamed protein product [Cladocopium goreaui]